MQATPPGVWGDYLQPFVAMTTTKLPEITGPFVKFANLVRAITGVVPRNQAEYRGNVSHMTIAKMWKGEKVSETMIIRFAKGYKVDPNPLLKAMGYDPLPSELASSGAPLDFQEDCLDRLAPTGFENMPEAAHEQAKQAALQAYQMMYRLEMERWAARSTTSQFQDSAIVDTREHVRSSPDPAEIVPDIKPINQEEKDEVDSTFPGMKYREKPKE